MDLGEALPETPVIRLLHPRLDLFCKLEYCNIHGSSKDRSAYWILRRAIERGDVTEKTTVIESSSGNFALSMASFCRLLGLTFVPVIDPNTNPATEMQLRLLCERVEKVTEADGAGGYLQVRLARIRRLLTELPAAYWPNQYANADARQAHERLTGAELCRALERLDYLFVGVSTAGTIAGLSRQAKRAFPGVRVVAVDSAGSAIFGNPPRRRRIPGLGSSIVPPLLDSALIDEVVIVEEADAVAGCHRLLSEHGIFAGGSTGSVYAAITRYFADYEDFTVPESFTDTRSFAAAERLTDPGSFQGPASGRPAVAFICADRGVAYADTLYNPEWVRDALGAESGMIAGV
ncbi:cysteine synthase A [Thermocatellispora tengchongensis]|uniref:Cysteine synthase A n=1 Tax=Thermocatellispora tengchongensis TaxID=1073253 RepID=A0A840PHI7_9ACTN|nr:2,3-diaminopropionate biosynthesis protein SbnA [Thermocatellispora tengchongensis]MBB5135505.1 cysteine synthase A [Thermocatellispora tengchongensis]